MNPLAARGFQSGADAYERGRPDYSVDAVRHLVERLGISPASSVLDIAAGTGKFTRHLALTGANIIAVEPVEGMRAKFRNSLPKTDMVAGLAELLPFNSSSLDAVVAAQSFHWFDSAKAVKEIHRVLKPSAGLGLIWNVRDESVPWVADLSKIVNKYWDAGGIPRYWEGSWKSGFDGSNLFTPLQLAEFRYVQVSDLPTMLDRFSSISYISTLPESERSAFLESIRELMERWGVISKERMVELPYRVDVFWCYRA